MIFMPGHGQDEADGKPEGDGGAVAHDDAYEGGPAFAVGAGAAPKPDEGFGEPA